jgi:hypothetical protein
MEFNGAAHSHTQAISLIRADLKIREESVYNSIQQLSLLYSGLQRCRRMKWALQAEEQQLQKQLELLDEDGNHSLIGRVQNDVVMDLLRSQTSEQAQASLAAQEPGDTANHEACERSTGPDRRT